MFQIACGTTHFFNGVFRPWPLIAFGQGQCVGVDLRGGSLFRWLSQGAKKWEQHGRITSGGGGGGVVHIGEVVDCKDIR